MSCRTGPFSDDKIAFAFAFDSEIAEIKETGGMVSGVVLRDVRTGTTRELDVMGMFIAIGHDPRTELFTGQLELDAEGYIKVESPLAGIGPSPRPPRAHERHRPSRHRACCPSSRPQT